MKAGMKFFVLAAAGICLSFSAQAAAIFTISDGINPLISVVDNGPGDASSSPGAIVVQTNVGAWSLTIDTAVTKPIVGSSTSPVLDINLIAESTTGGTLTLTFSDNNFGPATGTGNAVFTGETVYGPPCLAGMSVYGDPANVSGAMTVPITSIPPTLLATSGSVATSSGVVTLSAPYSLTEVAQVTAGGATLVDLDASFNLTPVPEPGVFALGALGIVGWVLRRARNRRA